MSEIFIYQSFDLANGNMEILREFLLLLFGGLIALCGAIAATTYTKNKEVESISIANAQQVSLLLILERSSLKKVDYFIQNTTATKTPQKVFATGLYLKIEEEHLIKILQYKKFKDIKLMYQYAEIMQRLIAAEQVYRDCYLLIELYNHNVQGLLEARTESPSRAARIKGYRVELESTFSNIVEKHNQAVEINQKAKTEFDTFCIEVFGEEKYKPVLATNNFVKADQI